MFWQLGSSNLKWDISCCSALRKQYRAYFFMADVMLKTEKTCNKINLSHTTQWVKCLFSHSPAHPPALSGNWKAVWCSFSIWTAPQTSAASVTASFVFPIKRDACLPSHIYCILIWETMHPSGAWFPFSTFSWLNKSVRCRGIHPAKQDGNNL